MKTTSSHKSEKRTPIPNCGGVFVALEPYAAYLTNPQPHVNPPPPPENPDLLIQPYKNFGDKFAELAACITVRAVPMSNGPEEVPPFLFREALYAAADRIGTSLSTCDRWGKSLTRCIHPIALTASIIIRDEMLNAADLWLDKTVKPLPPPFSLG